MKGTAKTHRSLWANRDFLLVWSGQAVSYFGTRVSNLTLPLIVLAITHSAAQAGFLASARMIPYLLFGLPAGALVDRWNRKTVMIVCDLVRFLALGSVPLAYLFGHLGLPQLYLVTFVQGTAFVFFNVAEIAALPHVVPKTQLAQATALDSTAGSAASLLGPGLAGIIIGAARTTAAGAALVYGVDSLTYLASLLSLGFIRTQFQTEHAPRPLSELRREIGEGLHFLWAKPRLRALALLTTALALLYAPVPLAMIVLAKGSMHASSRTIGLVFSVAAVGGLLGSALAPWFKSRVRLGQAMVGCVMMQALLTPMLALATSPWTLALGWGVLFMIDPIFYAYSITYRLSVTPDKLQGRIQSVFRLLAYGAEPLGTAAGGLLLGLVGPRLEIWGVAAGVALCAVLVSVSRLRQA